MTPFLLQETAGNRRSCIFFQTWVVDFNNPEGLCALSDGLDILLISL